MLIGLLSKKLLTSNHPKTLTGIETWIGGTKIGQQSTPITPKPLQGLKLLQLPIKAYSKG